MESESNLETFRGRIDRIDEELMRLLAERFGLTNQIGRYKKAQQLNAVDEEREQQQLARIRQLAVEVGINPGFAVKLLRGIIDEVVRSHKNL